MKQKNQLQEQLIENLNSLEHSIDVLKYSFHKCQNIKININISNEELESLEALTARYARSSDILTQKVFKSLLLYLGEDIVTFLDTVNFLEKIKIVENAEFLINIRALRNEISHEYSEQELYELFENTLEYTPLLIDIFDKTTKYIKEKIK